MNKPARTVLPQPSIPQAVDFLLELFRVRGDAMYAGEPVTQTQHALQCAAMAKASGAGDAMIAAALLHDVGHLLHELGEHCAEDGIDDDHERTGAAWLADYFRPDVTEPIRLHVPAKRYRCAVDANYHAKLSDASRLSLRIQGGPFTQEEAARFLQTPFAREALQLRLWDEAAKIMNKDTVRLAHYRTLLESLLGP